MDHQERWYSEVIQLSQQVIADVGANVGKLSQFFWEAGRGSNQVYSIEPLPVNLQYIRARIAQCHAENWHVIAEAASDRAGEVALRVRNHPAHGWNSVVSTSPATTGDSGLVVVPSRPLPDMVPAATVVKMDIEGYEYPILDQSIALLKTVHTWAVELHYVPDRPLQRVLQQFADHGFTLVAAAQTPGDRSGRWSSAVITPQLSWERIPGVRKTPAGPEFKMLHIVARR